MIIAEAVYLEHFGVKGMKWGKRKAKRQARKAAQKEEYRKFTEAVLKDVKARPLSEMYYTTGQQGNLVQTGKELVTAMNLGIKVTSVASTGYKLDDKEEVKK